MASLRLRALALLLVCAPHAGCYLSHRRAADAPVDGSVLDAGLRDAGSTRDAMTSDAATRDGGNVGGVFWRLEPRTARVYFANELGCTAFEGGSLAVTVTVTLESECDRTGPVDVERAPDGTFIVHAYAWAEHHPPGDTSCRPLAPIDNRHILVEATAPEVRVVDALTGNEARARVLPTPPDVVCAATRGPAEACRQDCECGSGLRCIPMLGDIVECFGGQCGTACDIEFNGRGVLYDRNIGCPADQACTDTGLASMVCAPASTGCGGPVCPDGLACPGVDSIQRCDWNFELRPENRRACADERDCDLGLHCVESSRGTRTCEVPCLMNEMACPPMHSCSASGSEWICEWIGE